MVGVWLRLVVRPIRSIGFASAAMALMAIAPYSASAAGQFQFENYQEVDPPSQLRADIERWSRAVEANDAEQIAGFYAQQGWLKLPCSPAGFGRTAIVERWRALHTQGPVSLSLHPSSFELSRGSDMVIERGWAQLMQNVGGLPDATNVDYLRVWSRRDGAWRIAADIFAPGGACAEPSR